MGPDSKILDDIARVAGGAVNIVSGLQQQIRDDIKNRIEEMAARMDIVPREDMDQALAQIRALYDRVEKLEKRLGECEAGKAKKKPAIKPAAKKPAKGKKKQ